MIHMQCPGCGYDADDAAVFCPQCRFRFRNAPDEPLFETEESEPEAPVETVMDLPERGFADDDSISQEAEKAFTGKELRLLEVQLIQPAVLIVLVGSLVTYTVIMDIPFIPLTIGRLSFSLAGIVCLIAGLAAGITFFFLCRRSLRQFRYR